jgi:hypothetical protein
LRPRFRNWTSVWHDWSKSMVWLSLNFSDV